MISFVTLLSIEYVLCTLYNDNNECSILKKQTLNRERMKWSKKITQTTNECAETMERNQSEIKNILELKVERQSSNQR